MKGQRGTLKLVSGDEAEAVAPTVRTPAEVDRAAPREAPKKTSRGTVMMGDGQDPSPAPSPALQTDESAFDPRRTLAGDDDRPMLLQGERIGDVVIRALLARGGICEIHVGWHELFHEEVAVKVLTQRFSARPDVVARMEVEARSLRQLQGHLGIVKVMHAGRDPRVGPFIVMELLRGKTLRDIMASGPLPIARAVAVVILIAEALANLHKFDITHRDLKPENVFIEPNKDTALGFRLVLLDFGCVKAPYSAHTADEARTMGTARYMSPEHCQRQKLGPRADQFALGHMLYEMLFGEHAFEAMSRALGGASPFLEMGWQCLAVIEPLPESICPARLTAVMMRMLEKDPEKRFASMDDIATELARFLTDFVKNMSDEQDRDKILEIARAAGPRISIPEEKVAQLTQPSIKTGRCPVAILSSRIVAPTVLIEWNRDGETMRTRHVFAQGGVIGREQQPGVDLVIDHPSVSRRHAEIRPAPGTDVEGSDPAFEVADLGSVNGVEIGGRSRKSGCGERTTSSRSATSA